MTVLALPYRTYELPWTAGVEQERAFRKTLKITLGAVLVLALILSVLPTPERDPTAVPPIPERFARLVLDQPKPPPPPVVREEPAPAPKAEEPSKPEAKPEPRPREPERAAEREPAPTTPEPARESSPAERAQRARARASGAGLLPFAEQLAALRDSAPVEQLDRKVLGGPAEPAAAVPVAERALITSRAGRGSGGINTAALSRNTGGSGLAGREITHVEGPEGLGLGGDGQGSGGAGAGAGGGSGENASPSRSREEIERIFDKNKGAIYALYNRALRQNPALEGKVVLRLTIAPDGRVTACEIVSSELGDPDLEQKLVQRVLLFKFEAKDVGAVTTTKPIDFFPA
jgi:TonB family protein